MKSLLVLVILFCALPLHLNAEESITYEKFVEDVRDKRSISEAIATLPTSFRRYFTFMHTSRSLQSATHDNPRTILYGPDAKFIVAFTGESITSDPELEIIQFRDETKQFEFRNIVFPSDGTAPIFSEKNPPVCASCHQQKPIWDSYARWVGAYGEFDDELENSIRVRYRLFRNSIKNDSVYAPLVFEENNLFAPYGTGVYGPIKDRPNLILGKFLARHQAAHLAQRIASSPNAEKLAILLIQAGTSCVAEEGSWKKMAATAGLSIDTQHDNFEAIKYDIFSLSGITRKDLTIHFSRDAAFQSNYFDGQSDIESLLVRAAYDSLALKYPNLAKVLDGARDERTNDKDPESQEINARINSLGFQLRRSELRCREIRSLF